MSQIGTFTRTPDGFFGRIRTLTLDAEVAILPADDTDAENAPEHRVFLDGVEVGAAWERTSEKAGTWLSLTIDDPSFAEPVRARLFEADAKKGTWGLHWSRRMRRDSERDVMCGNRSCTSFFSLPSIDHVPVTPLDPIANVEAVARSEGQGRRRFFRLTVMLSTVARPENIGRRRSLALDRSEHDGRLMGHRDGGACATVPAIMAMFCASMIVTAFPLQHSPVNVPSTRRTTEPLSLHRRGIVLTVVHQLTPTMPIHGRSTSPKPPAASPFRSGGFALSWLSKVRATCAPCHPPVRWA